MLCDSAPVAWAIDVNPLKQQLLLICLQMQREEQGLVAASSRSVQAATALMISRLTPQSGWKIGKLRLSMTR
jgi:hypothetical protein